MRPESKRRRPKRSSDNLSLLVVLELTQDTISINECVADWSQCHQTSHDILGPSPERFTYETGLP